MINNDITAHVEKFINDLHSGNIQILPKAQHLELCQEEKKLGIANKTKKIGTLAFLLGESISLYEQTKSNPLLRFRCAKTLSEYIEWAYTYKVIKQVKLTEKIVELEEENNRLREENASLKKVNTKLAEENTKIHKNFPDSQRGKTETGGLSKP
jgi:hypothetical protein